MRTHALMVELRERLLGKEEGDSVRPERGTAAGGPESKDWPRLPCGPAPADRDLLERLRKATIAQIGVGRAGVRLRTTTLLKFLGDRAVAVEAVRSKLPESFATTIGAAVQVKTLARDLDEFLLRPDLGRKLPEDELAKVHACPKGADVIVVVGDGLSAHAVALNAPAFLAAFRPECERLGLRVGCTVLVERARVKVMDQIGAALGARTAIILIGERPGLGTGDGMSAYMVHGPAAETFDSDKEVLSNIHARGTTPEEAGRKVAAMLVEFLRAGASGVKRLAAGPSAHDTARAEPSQPRDLFIERHATRPERGAHSPSAHAPPPPPLATSGAARCAG
jgi:ethanolamine ammonia-lyase small subunit